MKLQNWKSKLAMAMVAGGFAGFSTSVVNADISATLTGTGVGDNDPIPAGHGSNAEVTLAWSPDGGTPTTTWDAYNSWPNAGADGVYQVDGLRPWISFTPAAGIAVRFNSFDFNIWKGQGSYNYDVRIFAGSAPGADGTEVLLSSGTATGQGAPFAAAISDITNVSLNFQGVVDQAYTVEFRQLPVGTQTPSYMAIDNFSFQTTAVPEPGALALLGLGGLGATLMRRRRSDGSSVSI